MWVMGMMVKRGRRREKKREHGAFFGNTYSIFLVAIV
jgi:hypothetical protein